MEAEVLKTPFTSSDTLVVIWNPIEKLKQLAIQACHEYCEAQLIKFALHIIRSTHSFEKSLGEWNARPVSQKTWSNLRLILAMYKKS